MRKFILEHRAVGIIVLGFILSVFLIFVSVGCSKTETYTTSSHQVEYNYVIQRYEDTLFFYKIIGIQNGVILIENTPIAKGTTKDCDYNF
jgi:hypothetical protein